MDTVAESTVESYIYLLNIIILLTNRTNISMFILVVLNEGRICELHIICSHLELQPSIFVSILH